jgi:hypothetical protein
MLHDDMNQAAKSGHNPNPPYQAMLFLGTAQESFVSWENPSSAVNKTDRDGPEAENSIVQKHV